MLVTVLVAAVLAGFLLLEAAATARAGDLGSAIPLAIMGGLVTMIVVLWMLILFAPDLPTHPTRLWLDGSGLRVTRSRGPESYVAWDTPGLRLFVLDTRPSVRRPSTTDSPVLSLYAKEVGEIPLTEEGAEALEAFARQHGFRVVDLPQGEYGPLPRRAKMRLPFGSKVAFLTRP